MEKTPLSCLNELCSRRKLMPYYELIFEIPSKKFECQLNLDGNNTKFTDILVKSNGRSKKEAKHFAAYKALKLIKEKSDNNSKNDVDDCELNEIEKVITLFDNKIKENNLYKLKAICLTNLLPTPQYLLINNYVNCKKVYHLKCVVAGLIEKGCSYSKNDARQISAGFMINKIKSILQSNFVDPENILHNDNNTEDGGNKEQIDKKYIDKYNMIAEYKHKTFKNNYKIKIDNYHNVMLEEEFLYMNYIIKTTLNNYDDLSIENLLNPILVDLA
ncbi:uncharacterized protein LOC142330728 [Lycorma delicatula]|uniref:uncharacterized protein LOC142330728 n=1 Tax=Lycorma delicatula TaxID=130591 RepID=UPI003F512AE1